MEQEAPLTQEEQEVSDVMEEIGQDTNLVPIFKRLSDERTDAIIQSTVAQANYIKAVNIIVRLRKENQSLRAEQLAAATTQKEK